MPRSLQPLFQAIAMAPTETALRWTLMDQMSDYFGVQRWGIYLANADHELESVDAVGVSDAFVERYQQVGRTVDPVLNYVVQYHAPAHEQLVLPEGGWKQSELYQHCCSTQDHEHIMTGPIVGQGELIGTINFARVRETPAFNQADLANLGAVCAHVSARLATLRGESQWPSARKVKLTDRELQIAHLVAQGLTNAEIGAELWISQNTVKQALKRMFRKLNVASRTAMVVKLSQD